MLERAATKRMHPGLWTGMGGRVEADEMGDLTASALRELHEESGIGARDVTDFALRRVVFHARPGAPLTTLLYFTGTLTTACCRTARKGRSPGSRRNSCLASR